MKDEDIQQRVEQGNHSDDRETRAYVRIFDALNREPDFSLPVSFASRVASRVMAGRSSRDIYWLYAGLAACVMAMLVAVLMTGFKLDFGAFKFISGYPGFITFAIAFVAALQWLDKSIVRKAS